jgi:hypothetical protein
MLHDACVPLIEQRQCEDTCSYSRKRHYFIPTLTVVTGPFDLFWVTFSKSYITGETNF